MIVLGVDTAAAKSKRGFAIVAVPAVGGPPRLLALGSNLERVIDGAGVAAAEWQRGVTVATERPWTAAPSAARRDGLQGGESLLAPAGGLRGEALITFAVNLGWQLRDAGARLQAHGQGLWVERYVEVPVRVWKGAIFGTSFASAAKPAFTANLRQKFGPVADGATDDAVDAAGIAWAVALGAKGRALR